jgi:hypothetical protein
MIRKVLTSVVITFVMGAGAHSLSAQANTYTPHPRVYKVDSRKIVLSPGQGIEVKYHINKGSAMLYSWTSTAVVPFEFHGVPDQIPAGAPKDYYESHEKDDTGKNASHGHFVSPSTGIHGWWWENKTQNEVTVTLVTAGFYNKAIEFSRAGEKELPIQDAK